MKIEKTAFLSAMKKCLPGVDKGKSVIEGTDTFVFSNNAIHSYNDSISVSTPFKFENEINGAIKSIDFFKLISKLPTDTIELDSTEKEFKLTSGSTEVQMFKIQSKISDYISTMDIDKLQWKDIPANFFDAVKLCIITANNEPQRGIFVNENIMVSTDVKRINQHILSTEMDRFWINDLAVNDLIKIEGLAHYSVSDAWVHFKGKDGIIFSIKRNEDSSYPIQKIMMLIEGSKKQDEDIENDLPKELYNAADRVATLSSEFDSSPAIKMTVRKDHIEFFAERYTGKIKERIDLEKPFEKDVDLQMWVDPFFLIQIAKKVSSFYIKSVEMEDGDVVSRLIFYNKDYIQIASTFTGDAE